MSLRKLRIFSSFQFLNYNNEYPIVKIRISGGIPENIKFHLFTHAITLSQLTFSMENIFMKRNLEAELL